MASEGKDDWPLRGKVEWLLKEKMIGPCAEKWSGLCKERRLAPAQERGVASAQERKCGSCAEKWSGSFALVGHPREPSGQNPGGPLATGCGYVIVSEEATPGAALLQGATLPSTPTALLEFGI